MVKISVAYKEDTVGYGRAVCSCIYILCACVKEAQLVIVIVIHNRYISVACSAIFLAYLYSN